jgi:hypothetical protein
MLCGCGGHRDDVGTDIEGVGQRYQGHRAEQYRSWEALPDQRRQSLAGDQTEPRAGFLYGNRQRQRG